MISQAPDYRKLAEYFHDEYEPKHLAHLSEPSRRNWRKGIRAFLRFTSATVTIGELNQETVEEFDEWLHGKGFHLQTVAYYGAMVRKVLHKADSTRFKTRAMQPLNFQPEASDKDGTLWHFLETIYIPSRMGGLKDGTVKHMKIVLRALDRWAGRSVMVKELSDDLVTGFLNWFAGRRAPTTLNSMRGVILTLWNYAWKKRLIRRLPRVEKLRVPKRLPQCWSLDELRQLLQGCRDTKGWVNGAPAGLWWYGLAHLLYFTGLRINAATQLAAQHFDFDGAIVRVPAEFQKQNADQAFHLHPETVRVVREIATYRNGEPIFAWIGSRKTFFAAFRRILKRTGLSATRKDLFHKLRRTFCTMLTAKTSAEEASRQLGHSCMQVTRGYIDESKLPGFNAAQLLPDPGPMKPKPVETEQPSAIAANPAIAAILRKDDLDREDVKQVVAFTDSLGIRRVELVARARLNYATLANILAGVLIVSRKTRDKLRAAFGVEGGAA
jgi:integrase